MKKTTLYKGISYIKYTLSQRDLEDAALDGVTNDSLYHASYKPMEWEFEWGEHENGNVYLEVTQKIICDERKNS